MLHDVAQFDQAFSLHIAESSQPAFSDFVDCLGIDRLVLRLTNLNRADDAAFFQDLKMPQDRRPGEVVEADRNFAGRQHGPLRYDSRLYRQPVASVVMATSMTILGLIPLLTDVFFVNMSITIMAGLGFATFVTLLFVSVLYSYMFGAKYVART